MTQGEISFSSERSGEFLHAHVARDAALEQVETNNAEWVERAAAILKSACAHLESFTSEDLWLACAQLGHVREPRAMGAVMTRGRKCGWCEPTSEWITGWRAASHGRPVRVWRSLLHV
jgi:hypothetical protein